MSRSPREIAAQKIQQRKQQEQLFKDLLVVLDHLDHACDHWQQVVSTQYNRQQQTIKAQAPVPQPTSAQPQSWWRRVIRWLEHYYANRSGNPNDLSAPVNTSRSKQSDNQPSGPDRSMDDVVTSAQDGIEMIQKSMLEVLHKYQVVPLTAQGQPFDPTQMYALSQRTDSTVPANTVVEEVVKGYLWKDRVLRESQVIVAVAPTDIPTDIQEK